MTAHTTVSDADLPLAGVRVVEFTHMVMGPTCGMVLADLGAEVIKVEPVAGDNTRKLLGSGAGFFPLFNRNKKSIALDLSNPQGREAALADGLGRPLASALLAQDGSVSALRVTLVDADQGLVRTRVNDALGTASAARFPLMIVLHGAGERGRYGSAGRTRKILPPRSRPRNAAPVSGGCPSGIIIAELQRKISGRLGNSAAVAVNRNFGNINC